jgi:hypothetical protein
MMVGAALLAASAPAQAQCASGTTQDACRKAVDLFNFLTPQISGALSGGAASIGQGGVLGGFPHWNVGVRATAVQGTFPKIESIGFSTSGQQATTYTGSDQLIPMATIDGSVGIFGGIPLGVTKVGGVDLLLNATYIPTVPDGGDVSMTLPGGSTKFGFGVRLGLLQESLLVPGVAFTYVQRALPTITVSGKSTVTASGSTAPGSFAMNDLTIKSNSWRLSAGKSFAIFGLNAGVGQDKYDNSAGLDVTVNAAAPVGTQRVTASASNTMTRTNLYVGASLNFIIGKLAAEYGMLSGGTLPAALNKVGSEDAAVGRSYFSVGLRFGF